MRDFILRSGTILRHSRLAGSESANHLSQASQHFKSWCSLAIRSYCTCLVIGNSFQSFFNDHAVTSYGPPFGNFPLLARWAVAFFQRQQVIMQLLKFVHPYSFGNGWPHGDSNFSTILKRRSLCLYIPWQFALSCRSFASVRQSSMSRFSSA